MLVLVRFQQQPAHSQHACRLLDDSNALILPAKGDRPAAAGAADGGCETATAEAGPPAKQLSKSQLRKLRKIQEEKEKRERRADVMATLAAHQVGCRPDAHHAPADGGTDALMLPAQKGKPVLLHAAKACACRPHTAVLL